MALRARGIAADAPTAGTVARFVAVTDPDGNTITIAGTLSDGGR